MNEQQPKVAYIHLKKLKSTHQDEGFSEAVHPDEWLAEKNLGVITGDYINTYHIVLGDTEYLNGLDTAHRQQYTLRLESCTTNEALFTKVVGSRESYSIPVDHSHIIQIPERDEEVEIEVIEILDLDEWLERIRA